MFDDEKERRKTLFRLDGFDMKKIMILTCNDGKVCRSLPLPSRLIRLVLCLRLAPRIGCLNFHSLLELRRGLQYGNQR